MQARDIPVSTLVLGLFAVWALLVALVAFGGLGGRVSLHPDDPAAVPPVPTLDLSRARTELPEPEHYAEVGQRPLFNADRRPVPPDEAPAGEAEAPPPAPLEITLTSVIISGDTRIAIVQDNRSRASQSVRVGSSLEGEQVGWKLVELQARKAVFEGPTGRAEAELRVFDGSGGEAPTALTAQPAGADGATVAATNADGSAEQPSEPGTAAAETPESRAELIRRRIEERRRQMREAAARGNNDSKE